MILSGKLLSAPQIPQSFPDCFIRGERMRLRRKYWPVIFIAPFFIVYGIFNLFPLIFSFYISLTKWKGYGPMTFTGLFNYRSLLKDAAFYRSIGNSFVIVLEAMIPIQSLGLLLALLLNYGVIRFGRRYIRNVMFLPYLTAPVAIGLIFSILLDQNFGAVNQFLSRVGLIKQNIDWLHTSSLAKPLVAFITNWRYIGYTSVIYLAGLQSVPRELFEAAKADGATTTQAILRIVLPLLRPIIIFEVTNGIIGCLKIFEEPYMLFGNYKGGVGNAAQTMNMKYLDTAFMARQTSYGAATGYAMFVVIMAFTLLYFRIVNRKEEF